MSDLFSFQKIGVIESPWNEKFAIPRQPGLVSEANARLVLESPFNTEQCVAELSQFSHIWVLFIFHKTMAKGWNPQVRPPRLGGNKKVGVFASRSTFRPNPIGMSAVKLAGVSLEQGKAVLQLKGIDLVNGTPVIDIKPYIPYSDNVALASGGYADNPPDATMPVQFTDDVLQDIEALQQQAPEYYGNLTDFISQVLQQDPRPAYKQQNTKRQLYGVHLYDFDLRWFVEDNVTTVYEIERRK